MTLRPPRSTLFPYTRSSDLIFPDSPNVHGHDRDPRFRWSRENATRQSPRSKVHHLPAPSKSRSEEHTSELQSRQYLVCRLLLEKKKKRAPQRREDELPPRDS